MSRPGIEVWVSVAARGGRVTRHLVMEGCSRAMCGVWVQRRPTEADAGARGCARCETTMRAWERRRSLRADHMWPDGTL